LEVVENPFTPGYARRPPVLAGRAGILALIDSSASIVINGSTPPAIILSGPRGVGKTVVLHEAAARLGQRHGWSTLALEARDDEPLVVSLREGAQDLVAGWDQTPRRTGWVADEARLGARVGGMEAAATWRRRDEPGRADSVEAILRDLVAAAAARDTAVLLTIDEAHQLRSGDLRSLGRCLSAATGQDGPVVAIFAGLPGLEAQTGKVTYLERARWRDLGPLGHDDTIEALVTAAAAAGRPMVADAAELLAEASAGYPYAVQLYGAHAWDHAEGSPFIQLEHAQAAHGPAFEELESGLFRTRWQQASPRQRDYLTAVAALRSEGHRATGRAVAERLGRSTQQLSKTRSELLRKGTLIAADRALKFPVPGLAEFILRQRRSSGDDPPQDSRPEV
jgi:hypothetical protein